MEARQLERTKSGRVKPPGKPSPTQAPAETARGEPDVITPRTTPGDAPAAATSQPSVLRGPGIMGLDSFSRKLVELAPKIKSKKASPPPTTPHEEPTPAPTQAKKLTAGKPPTVLYAIGGLLAVGLLVLLGSRLAAKPAAAPIPAPGPLRLRRSQPDGYTLPEAM